MTGRFAAYLAQRFRPAVFAPATALHVGLALWAAGAEPTPARLASAAGLAALLLLQFRLWDDLEDRGRDRATHPERILVVAPPAPFRCALVAIGVGNLVVLAARSAVAAAGLAVLDVAFLAAYRLRPRVSDRLWRFGVLLAKYPVFVALVAAAIGAPPTPRLALAMAVMHAAAIGYEVHHNRPAEAEHRERHLGAANPRRPAMDAARRAEHCHELHDEANAPVRRWTPHGERSTAMSSTTKPTRPSRDGRRTESGALP